MYAYLKSLQHRPFGKRLSYFFHYLFLACVMHGCSSIDRRSKLHLRMSLCIDWIALNAPTQEKSFTNVINVHSTYLSAHKGCLTVHLRTHTGKKPYKCDQCAYSTTTKNSLAIHLRTHTGERPYKCDQCTYLTTTKSSLSVHFRTHTGEKPYKCDQCTYSYTRKGTLVIHLHTHTEKRHYKCDQCAY